MSAEDAIQTLKQVNIKEVNAACSKHNLNLRVDDYTQKKFETALRTAYLLVSQPIDIAISRQTKMDSMQSIKEMKKVFDSLFLITKDQKYKTYIDGLNEIMSHSKLR